MTDAARQALEEPDMTDGAGELYMPHALAPHLALRNLDPALIAHDTAVFHALEFAAETFPVGYGAEYLGAEQALAFRLERTVVDGFRLGHLSIGPRPDLLWTGQADPYGIEIIDRLGLVEEE
jgi:hypothetical protein